MLDALPATRLDRPQQDAAHAHDLCATSCGCRAGPRWYVVQSQPKAERTAHAALHLKGYEPYLPLITVRRSNRHYHTGPLFPRYLFCRIDLARPWYPIRWCPGVFSLIAVHGTPTPCPQGAVEAVRAAEAARRSQGPENRSWAPGTLCSLANGMFQGHRAVITEIHNNAAHVAVMFLGELRTLTVPLDALVPAGEP